MDLCPYLPGPDFPSFPRRRGDGPGPHRDPGRRREFPPQARGWTPCASWPRSVCTVSPAGAGMDRSLSRTGRAVPRFPRRRGDGPSQTSAKASSAVFPPQARGWTLDTYLPLCLTFVSPAGAGMDPRHRAVIARRESFPRRRGDGPLLVDVLPLRGAFPPQARGWTVGMGSSSGGMAVSPAGAGMDPPFAFSAFPSPGFPRRRGDGPSASVFAS